MLSTAGILADADLTHVTHVEALTLANGTNTITLGSLAQAAGIVTITGGTGADSINTSGHSGNLTISSGDGNDVLTFAIDYLDTNDTIDGGAGTDTIMLSTAGALADADLTHVTNVEALTLANGTNSITLEDYAAQAGIATVTGGTGNDTLVLTDDPAVLGSITAVTFNSGDGDDTFNIGGLTVTGTLTMGTGTDTIIATSGANIAGLNNGDVTTADALTLTGAITMTTAQAQHNVMTITASGESDTVTLTTTGSLTGQSTIEHYILSDSGNTFTQGSTDNNSVTGGLGNDTIISLSGSSADAARSDLVINIASGGNDIIKLHNAGTIAISNLYDYNTGNTTQLDEYGGTVLDGFHASSTVTADNASQYDTLVFTGTWASTVSAWESNSIGVDAVTIQGFVAGDGAGHDVLKIYQDDAVGSFNTADADITGSTFFNNVLLGSTSLAGAATTSIFELDANYHQITNASDLTAVATLLSNSGEGNALLGLHDGIYTVVIYNSVGAQGSDNPADAYVYQITVDEGDGLDFVSYEGSYSYDADSIELVAVMTDVGANALTGQNFILPT